MAAVNISADDNRLSYAQAGAKISAKIKHGDDRYFLVKIRSFDRQYDDLFSREISRIREDENRRFLFEYHHKLNNNFRIYSRVGRIDNRSNIRLREVDGTIVIFGGVVVF